MCHHSRTRELLDPTAQRHEPKLTPVALGVKCYLMVTTKLCAKHTSLPCPTSIEKAKAPDFGSNPACVFDSENPSAFLHRPSLAGSFLVIVVSSTPSFEGLISSVRAWSLTANVRPSLGTCQRV